MIALIKVWATLIKISLYMIVVFKFFGNFLLKFFRNINEHSVLANMETIKFRPPKQQKQQL